MKKIILAPIKEIKIGPTTVNFGHRATLEQILQTAEDPRQGISVAEMRKAIKILDKIEDQPNDVSFALILEDADYDYVLRRVRNFSFPFANKAILEFVSAVDDAVDPTLPQVED